MPVIADKDGFHPQAVGDLPPQLAALNQSNVTVQGLAVQAAIEGDPELAMAACALDPLTATTLTLKQIRDMAEEMFAAQAPWLPQFKGKKLNPTPTVKTPPGTKHIDVPLDPALAVVHRFGELAKKASQ